MSDKLSDLEMDAWQALLHAHHKLIRALEADLRAAHDLSMGDYDVLLRLARAPDRRLRMSTLAERVMLSPSGLTRAVDALGREGLVERARDDADARIVHARLTDAGLERIRAASRTHLKGIREHFTGRLTDAQLRDVAAGLQVISGPHQPH